MSEQAKKRQRIYDLLNTETKEKFLCLPFLQKKSFLRKRCDGGLNKKETKGISTGLATAIKKGTQRQ